MSNQDFTSRFQERIFTVDNTTAYSYYRLDIINHSGTILQLADWKLNTMPENPGESASQQFVIQDAGNGYYRLFNKNSDMLMEIIDDGVYAPGTRVRQMPDFDQEGALWKFIDVDSVHSFDCAGIINGTATLDKCGLCVGGTTGLDSCNSTAILYSNCNFTGTVTGLGEGSYKLTDLISHGFSDNALSSIKTEDEYAVQLFDDDDFNGTSVLIQNNDTCLSDISFDNKTTSLIVGLKASIDCAGYIGGSAYFDHCGTCVGGTTGLDSCATSVENAVTEKIDLYPNPVDRLLNLNLDQEWAGCTIKILNMEGIMTWNGYFENKPLDVANLPSGVYMIQIIRNNQVAILRFVKK